MHKNILLPALLAILAGLPAAETAIVNPAVSVDSVSEDQFKDIYLGRKTSWDNGAKIVVAVPEGGSGEALMKVLGKSQSQFATGWKKLVFSGKGVMPETLKDDDAVIAYVAKTPGAIGFVNAEKVKEGVKPIATK